MIKKQTEPGQKRILHIIPDEKFLDTTISIFSEQRQAINRFIVYRTTGRDYSKYNIYRETEVALADASYLVSSKLSCDVMWADCIIVHALTLFPMILLVRMRRDIPVLWSAWGSDYFCYNPDGETVYLGPLTKGLVEANKRSEAGSAFAYRFLLRRTKNWLRRTLIQYVAHKITHFSAPVPGDYSLVKAWLGSRFLATTAQLRYVTVEDTFEHGDSNALGDNILVGNSATASNNHLEVFELLKGCLPDGVKVIVPLTYGDGWYRESIIRVGNDYFGSSFVPITEHLPLPEYNKLISSCSIVVMNQMRQQALGNICTALNLGCRVFLNSSSSTFEYLSEQGFEIDSIDNLRCMLAQHSLKEIEKTRATLRKLYGKEVVHKDIQCYLDRI